MSCCSSYPLASCTASEKVSSAGVRIVLGNYRYFSSLLFLSCVVHHFI